MKQSTNCKSTYFFPTKVYECTIALRLVSSMSILCKWESWNDLKGKNSLFTPTDSSEKSDDQYGLGKTLKEMFTFRNGV